MSAQYAVVHLTGETDGPKSGALAVGQPQPARWLPGACMTQPDDDLDNRWCRRRHLQNVWHKHYDDGCSHHQSCTTCALDWDLFAEYITAGTGGWGMLQCRDLPGDTMNSSVSPAAARASAGLDMPRLTGSFAFALSWTIN